MKTNNTESKKSTSKKIHKNGKDELSKKGFMETPCRPSKEARRDASQADVGKKELEKDEVLPRPSKQG